MRVFYIFKINKYFTYVYQNKAYKMYKLLEEIYYLKIDYSFCLIVLVGLVCFFIGYNIVYTSKIDKK